MIRGALDTVLGIGSGSSHPAGRTMSGSFQPAACSSPGALDVLLRLDLNSDDIFSSARRGPLDVLAIVSG
eukprot:1691626-Rhodomonas_salina.2